MDKQHDFIEKQFTRLEVDRNLALLKLSHIMTQALYSLPHGCNSLHIINLPGGKTCINSRLPFSFYDIFSLVTVGPGS